jgi:phosphoenolpyruvate-protein phosphotransferase
MTSTGQEADLALKALQTLVEDNFGEVAIPESDLPFGGAVPAKTVQTRNGSLKAVSISDGIAIGPLYHYQPQVPTISTEPAQDPIEESQKLKRALDLVRNNIREQIRQLKASIGEANAAILEAHLLISQDPELVAQALKNIFQNHQNAAFAWHNSTEKIAASYRALEDDYLKQRAADVKDVENQILLALAGKTTYATPTFTEPVILYAQDITPTETAQLDLSAVLGIITTGGGPTSHSAILARALGIPAVSGASTTLAGLPIGTLVALDGSSGQVWIEPSESVQTELRARREAWLAPRQKLLQASSAPAVTRDGRRVEVFANIANLQDARAALKNGAEGVGLLRTEFLFLTRETPPSEEEQTLTLREIFETMGNQRPITTRTLDVGGDKKLPYIQLPEEPNPFLGVRALRLSLTRPDLFLTQIRAILRAAHGFPCRIMFPMVADVEEIRKARNWVEKAHHELKEENKPYAWPVELGIMVEIPSAALLAPVLANEVDFFSIGTNDLTQYTLAAERGNPALYHLADGLHPAVLRLIGEVVEAAHQAGKWTGICGELGGDPDAVPILVGLGVDELSLNSAGIPRIKSIIRDLTMETARSLAEQALHCQTSVEVRQLVRTFNR